MYIYIFIYSYIYIYTLYISHTFPGTNSATWCREGCKQRRGAKCEILLRLRSSNQPL